MGLEFKTDSRLPFPETYLTISPVLLLNLTTKFPSVISLIKFITPLPKKLYY